MRFFSLIIFVIACGGRAPATGIYQVTLTGGTGCASAPASTSATWTFDGNGNMVPDGNDPATCSTVQRPDRGEVTVTCTRTGAGFPKTLIELSDKDGAWPITLSGRVFNSGGDPSGGCPSLTYSAVAIK